MANGNWHNGRAKSRSQAKAWLRHNDKERRADPQIRHANREIDKSRTHLNFEVGPTKNLTLEEKFDRLEARLDEFGYPTDADLGEKNQNTPTCMQGIILNAPDALNTVEALEDGRFKKWADAAAEEVCACFGEENVIAMDADVDEQHVYTDAKTGEKRTSRFHVHCFVVPVCEVKQVKKQFVYLRPDGTETLEESEAERVYITVNNSETDDETKAAKNEDGTPKMGPKHARLKNGRRKVKKQKRSEATETKLKLSGSEFALSENKDKLNRAIHERTKRDFGFGWNTHEPGTYKRNPGDRNETVEELKAKTAEREIAQRVEEAAAEIEAKVKASQQTLDDAETAAETIKTDAETEAKRLKTDAETEAANAKREAEEAAKRRDNAKRTRDLYAGEAYIVTRSDGTREKHLGTKGLKKRNEELRTQNKDLHARNEELHTENEGLLAENKRLRKANANLSAREAAVADRERRAKEQAEENAKDAARNAAREKQLREGIAAVKLAQEAITNPTVTIEGEDADAYTARVVERTVFATADVFMRSTSPHEDVQRERRQLGSDLYAEADMAATMGTRMRLDDGSEGTLFSLVRDRVHAFMREPMGAIARAVDALSTRVRDYLAQAESALDFSSTFEDLNDEATGKPRTAKQQGQRTTRAVTAQRLVASIETGQSLDDIDSTPADDYGFGF